MRTHWGQVMMGSPHLSKMNVKCERGTHKEVLADQNIYPPGNYYYKQTQWILTDLYLELDLNIKQCRWGRIVDLVRKIKLKTGPFPQKHFLAAT